MHSLPTSPFDVTLMSDVQVDEIMTPRPTVFQGDMSVKDAARLMIDKDVSGGPVVDADGHLVGFLSESDLMWKGAGAPEDHYLIPPIYIGAFDLFFYLKDQAAVQNELRKVLAKKVADAMTKEVVSTQPKVSMSEASTMMLKHKVNSLPVVENGKVVGVLTRHDVLRALIASHSPLL